MATDAIDWALLTAQGGLTVDELLEQDIAGARMELIDGSLIAAPLGDLEHQALATVFAALLLGEQLPEECLALVGVNVIQGDRLLVIPDVAVVDPRHEVRGGLGVAPSGLLLAVEISSPSTRRADLTIKRELYRSWDVPYLIIDRATTPPTRVVNGDLPRFAEVLLRG
jgi:Uma2 family endonuclease